MNDPKLQLISDSLFRAWFNLMCIASAHDGVLPALKDIAFTLRLAPTKAAQILAQLHAVGLLDKTETGFVPHNWNGRQYKSDVSNERVKRHRQRKCNVTSAVTVTPPDTEDRNREQKDAEAKASGADAPRDVRAELFGRGLETLSRLTGKGPDACRSFVGKCLKAASDDAITVLGLIEDADRNRVVDPSAWISARLKGQQNGSTGQVSAASNDLVERVKRGFGGAPPEDPVGGRTGETDARLLSYGRG